jgi:DNA-binding Lrp family transcriptional regulator
MATIDLKDRKILYELDLNCRQSNTQIGKKVGLRKDVVAYRIKKMLDDGVIHHFETEMNTFKLGYDVFRIYIAFQNVSQDKKNEIIQYFCSCKNAWAVISSKGEIDLCVILWVKDNYEFHQFWENTLDKYEEYFAKYFVSVYIQAVSYKRTYLLQTNDEEPGRRLYDTTCGGTPVDIDETDYRLLDMLASNGRLPLIDLAEKLSCSSQSVSYRMNNLVKTGVIQGFRTRVDLSKLDLKAFKVDIFLKEHRFQKPIIDYIEKQPYLECLNVAVGWANIEPEIVVENLDRLTEILEDLDKKFPNTIRKQTFWASNIYHKTRWLPEFS